MSEMKNASEVAFNLQAELLSAQSELAALREELALSKAETDGCRAANMVLREELKTERLRADTSVGDANEAERRLTAAEQRNAELVELCAKICEERAAYYEAGDDDAPVSRRASACQNCADVIRHRFPTESGASE